MRVELLLINWPNTPKESHVFDYECLLYLLARFFVFIPIKVSSLSKFVFFIVNKEASKESIVENCQTLPRTVIPRPDLPQRLCNLLQLQCFES